MTITIEQVNIGDLLDHMRTTYKIIKKNKIYITVKGINGDNDNKIFSSCHPGVFENLRKSKITNWKEVIQNERIY